MTELVDIAVEDHVARVKLNRPEKYNALSVEMFEAIVRAGESLASNSSVRAVVLYGEGPGFCAGLDFESFMQMGTDHLEKGMAFFQKSPHGPGNRAQQVAYVWKQVPVPVIAAVHGAAYGGGFQLALAADIRIAGEAATFSVMEVKWGLVPDMSGTQTLRDLVRLDVAKELTFSGRIVAAEEALHLGLITRISKTPLEDAAALAKEIAAKSPDAVRAAKRLLEDAWHGDTESGLRREAELQQRIIGKANQIEAVMANFEKRMPRFNDPQTQ